MSQVTAVGAAPAVDNKPLKKLRRPPLKKVLVPRYLNILFFYLKTCCYADMCYEIGRPMLVNRLKLLSKSLLMSWQL
jgi:hypothetical protein